MSSQIIAFTDRIDFKTLLDIQCKSLTGMAPMIKEDPEEFTSFLGLLSEVDILIIDQPKSKKDYSFLLRVVSEKETEIKNVILISDEEDKTQKSLTFPSNGVDILIEHLKSLLTKDKPDQEEYISVPVESFFHFKILPFDLFIKISEGKFIKRIPANEDIEEETVKALKNKGIQELYFGKKHNREFSNFLLNNMINKVEQSYSSTDQKQKARSQVFQTTQEIVQSVGLPPRVIEVCESVMESISDDVLKSKDKLSSYLSQMKSSDLSFSFRLVELTSFIAVQMVELLDAGTEENIKKVVFAAFFSDISLTDPSHLEYRSTESIKNLWPEDRALIENHAAKSAQVVSKYKNAPEGAEVLIREHHGSMTGSGFNGVAPALQPLSKCLLSSQEIAFRMLKFPEQNPSQVLDNLSKEFENTPLQSFFVLFRESMSTVV